MPEEHVILQVSDWNLEDKYYDAPISLLKELRNRFLEARKKECASDAMSTAWKWWHEQVEYDKRDKGKPIKYGKVDMRLETFFLDYTEPDEGFKEWMECLDD
jgi:hypothetical protein